jgi:hypothetical protein
LCFPNLLIEKHTPEQQIIEYIRKVAHKTNFKRPMYEFKKTVLSAHFRILCLQLPPVSTNLKLDIPTSCHMDDKVYPNPPFKYPLKYLINVPTMV